MSTTDDTKTARRGSGSNDLLGLAAERGRWASICRAVMAEHGGDHSRQVSTQAAQVELERLRTENSALKRDLQYARDGLTKGRTRMRDDIERLREFVAIWIADGSLQTFEHREKFRAEAKALLKA